MSKQERDYLEGYRNALEELDVNITESIQRNNGATTLIQTLNVFNDTIASIQDQLARVNELLREDDDKRLVNLVDQMFILVTKGDK